MELRVYFDDGNHLDTRFNGTLEEAKKYYIGKTFNLGVDRDDMRKCTGLEPLHNEQGRLPEYHGLQLNLERLTDSLINTALERCELLGITTETARAAAYAYMAYSSIWDEDLTKWAGELRDSQQKGSPGLDISEDYETIIMSVEMLTKECWQLLRDEEVIDYRDRYVGLHDVRQALQAIKVPACAKQMQNLVAELIVLGADEMGKDQDIQDELSVADCTIKDVQSVYRYIMQH